MLKVLIINQVCWPSLLYLIWMAWNLVLVTYRNFLIWKCISHDLDLRWIYDKCINSKLSQTGIFLLITPSGKDLTTLKLLMMWYSFRYFWPNLFVEINKITQKTQKIHDYFYLGQIFYLQGLQSVGGSHKFTFFTDKKIKLQITAINKRINESI